MSDAVLEAVVSLSTEVWSLRSRIEASEKHPSGLEERLTKRVEVLQGVVDRYINVCLNRRCGAEEKKGTETETPTVDQEVVKTRKKVLLDYDEMYNKVESQSQALLVDLDMRIRTLEDVCDIGGDDSERRLKPCPFCLNAKGANLYQDLETDYFVICCVTCRCKGPLCETVREAREAWNKRS